MLSDSVFRIFQKIIADDSPPAEGEEHLAALTAGDRVPWAKARAEFFSKGKNKISLNTIEKVSFFFLCVPIFGHLIYFTKLLSFSSQLLLSS